ncbi:Putative peptidoglycan binding domain protein [Caballeronia cordobensis]|uniref:Putative peptidoglycan binding domain protein n=1 Tax=Caballeronia cordobensis TaxID=1353886 RepID=A0A158GIT5_CABCO|nr:peptidoglycan-binding protein [Caballeronia cordobensis]SAL31823.1 Putative peptidoglycan binding domain protein [Caballeronia cordobensis]
MDIRPFDGVILKAGIAAPDKVRLVQDRLRALGYGASVTGIFDAQTESVVKLFQAQHSDDSGLPLKIDGEIGFHTWTALFGVLPSVVQPVAQLLSQALAVAASQDHQMEVPRGSNRGPMVDEYLRAAGMDPTKGSPDSRPWCMCFMYWVFEQAAQHMNRATPLPKTASCHQHWAAAADLANVGRITRQQALDNRNLIQPGLIFILDFGGGMGHTGIVESVLPGGALQTIEGNTNTDGSRNGVGVFRLQRRKPSDTVLTGFVDYSKA